MGRLEQFHGAGDIEKMFPEGTPLTSVPFPQARRLKSHRDYDPDAVRNMLMAHDTPLTMVDPTTLHASQPSVTRAGVAHYMDPKNQESGETFADQGNAGNRAPVIYHRTDDEQKVILSGHHRATAALLQGRQFPARVVRGPRGPERGT